MKNRSAHFYGVYEILPEKLYQGAWSSQDWRLAVRAYQIYSFIDVAGMIPDPLPGYSFFASFVMKDNNTLPDMELLHAYASVGAKLVNANQKVMVCCVGGINRSALMCGLILHQLGLGSGPEIVSQLCDANPDCLENSTFRSYLERLPKKPITAP